MNEYLNEKEVAARYGLKVSTLRKWRSDKNPRAPRFTKLASRSVRYKASDLAEWESACREGRFVGPYSRFALAFRNSLAIVGTAE